MKLYNYETNIKNDNGEMVVLVGSNKKELEESFKDLGVIIGKRIKNTSRSLVVSHNYLEGQKQLLMKYLKLKKMFIEKEGK